MTLILKAVDAIYELLGDDTPVSNELLDTGAGRSSESNVSSESSSLRDWRQEKIM